MLLGSNFVSRHFFSRVSLFHSWKEFWHFFGVIGQSESKGKNLCLFVCYVGDEDSDGVDNTFRNRLIHIID